jgi:hypothetical protein
LDSIGQTIGVSNGDYSPWYQLSVREVMRLGASGFAHMYNGSLYQMLTDIYPNYRWLPWKFKHSPKHLAKDSKALELALSVLEVELNIIDPEDWYRVSTSQLKALGLYYFLEKFGGQAAALQRARPQLNWDPKKFGK